MVNPLTLMLACGRSGSFLSHALLLQNPNIAIPEGLGTLTELGDLRTIDASELERFCRSSLEEGNLWSLAPEQMPADYLDPNRSHRSCGCNRLSGTTTPIVLHIHNLLYNLSDFAYLESHYSDPDSRTSLKFLLPVRSSWLANISSRVKSGSFQGPPRWMMVIYWSIIENHAWRARNWLESQYHYKHLPLDRWHTDPIALWSECQSFLNVPAIEFPVEIDISGNRWTGGIDSAKPIDPQHAVKLASVQMSQMEQCIAKQFEPVLSETRTISRNARLLSFIAAVSAAIAMLVFLAPLNLVRGYDRCGHCSKHPNNQVNPPTFTKRLPSAVAQRLSHMLTHRGISHYLFGFAEASKWSRFLSVLANVK